MATDNRWISVDSIIKSAMIDMGDSTNTNYNRFMSWIIRGVNELGYDVFKRFKEVLLNVDASTYTAKLPDDYVQQVRVGLINTNGEYMPFTFNPNIVFDVEVPACHCDCGCCDEVCESLQDGSFVSEDISIAVPHWYSCTPFSGTKKTSICVDDNGNITKQICQDYAPPVRINPAGSGCWTIPNTFPFKSVSWAVDWVSYSYVAGTTIPTIDDMADQMNAVMVAAGFDDDMFYVSGSTICVAGQEHYYFDLAVSVDNVTFTYIAGVFSSIYVANGYALYSYNTTNMTGIISDVSIVENCEVVYSNATSAHAFEVFIAGLIGSNDFIFWNNKAWFVSTEKFGTLLFSKKPTNYTITPTQSGSDTYTITNVCVVEHLCAAEVLPECSCIVVTDAIVDVLTINSILENQAYNRWKRSGSILQTYATAGNVLGYYNINKENNVIYFNAGMPRKAVYLQYYSANEVDSGDFLVPVQAQETLIAYLDYKSKWSKSNVPMYEKQRAEKYWYNEKTKLKARLNPILMSEIQDILRTQPMRP